MTGTFKQEACVHIKLICGDEVDAIYGKAYLTFRAGKRKCIKRKINRRLRRLARLEFKKGEVA